MPLVVRAARGLSTAQRPTIDRPDFAEKLNDGKVRPAAIDSAFSRSFPRSSGLLPDEMQVRGALGGDLHMAQLMLGAVCRAYGIVARRQFGVEERSAPGDAE